MDSAQTRRSSVCREDPEVLTCLGVEGRSAPGRRSLYLRKDVWQNYGRDRYALLISRITESKDSERGCKALVQLADQTVAAPARAVDWRRRLFRLNEGSCAAASGSDPPMAVRSLDRRSIQNEDDEQQAKPSLKLGAVIEYCADQHAGHCLMC
jgi:hypothetical protein